MDSISILIGGDLVPTKSNLELFSAADTTELLGEDLQSVLGRVDFRIFNLEVPLVDQESPIKKYGPNLNAPANTIKGIKQIGADLLSLANNHILDHGERGLSSTINLLEENNIDYIGAGSNLNEARQSYVLEISGTRIGIYACAEHEFTIATKTSSGANPFDPLESLDHIHDLKDECDHLIVLYHGGKEHYRYPSPYLKKVCHKMVEKGADLVVCQHSHCIGAFEHHKDSNIIYGQGNFIFDDSESEFWQESLLLNVIFSSKDITIEYIPIIKEGHGVRLANKQKSEEIMREFYDRSKKISDEEFVEQEYNKFACQMVNGYLGAFHGRNMIFRILNKLFKNKLTTKLYSNESLVRIQNYVECEAHRELVLKGIKSYCK